jgi:hypothetical protein
VICAHCAFGYQWHGDKPINMIMGFSAIMVWMMATLGAVMIRTRDF